MRCIGIKQCLWLTAAVLAILMVGCEVDELYVSSSSSGVAFYFAGRWNGVVATAHGGSTLRLDDSHGTINGVWVGPNGTRTLYGTSSGPAVVLTIQGGDVWNLRLSDNTLAGTGSHSGGGEYPVRFTREGY